MSAPCKCCGQRFFQFGRLVLGRGRPGGEPRMGFFKRTHSPYGWYLFGGFFSVSWEGRK